MNLRRWKLLFPCRHIWFVAEFEKPSCCAVNSCKKCIDLSQWIWNRNKCFAYCVLDCKSNFRRTVLLDCHPHSPMRMLTHFQPQCRRETLLYDKVSIVSSIYWILTQSSSLHPEKWSWIIFAWTKHLLIAVCVVYVCVRQNKGCKKCVTPENEVGQGRARSG